ncbi:hypothetical protein RHSIM_Rhsim11G0097000 [Rhododendron simsii]|uniref:Uncharacterized protein n=1 Tax=Rhododendron simsii TaxID=118357 RepID=A0A834GAY2_RHOSS|nr:hypothetical protein RHSIM_Rhsim11G0097000 [Rhododendron simsii]
MFLLVQRKCVRVPFCAHGVTCQPGALFSAVASLYNLSARAVPFCAHGATCWLGALRSAVASLYNLSARARHTSRGVVPMLARPREPFINGQAAPFDPKYYRNWEDKPGSETSAAMMKRKRQKG